MCLIFVALIPLHGFFMADFSLAVVCVDVGAFMTDFGAALVFVVFGAFMTAFGFDVVFGDVGADMMDLGHAQNRKRLLSSQ